MGKNMWKRVYMLCLKLFLKLAYKIVHSLPSPIATLCYKFNFLIRSRNPVIKIHEESLRTIADFLNRSRFQTINLIDVGCYQGDFLNQFQSRIRKRIFSIGIDPIRHHLIVPYSIFIEVAIINKPEGVYDFYEYAISSYNSLKRMNFSNITHDNRERNKKWFVERHIESLLKIRPVKTVHLSTIIKRLKMDNDIIHFLKIDVQGCDLEVLLSLGEYTKNCLFVQLETVISKNKNIVLYENQTIFDEEKPIIEKLGFKLFSLVDYRKVGTSPEADVIFINMKLITNILQQ